MEKFDALKEKILHLRNSGTVRCELVSVEDKDVPNSLLDMLEEINNLSEPANTVLNSLKEIDKDLAQKIITQILFKDMAYGVEVIDEKTSSELAHDFVSLFSENAKFFSNESEDFIKFQQKQISVYSAAAITNATFSAGVFVVDTIFSGFILVEDED
jgi:hypothetical protein